MFSYLKDKLSGSGTDDEESEEPGDETDEQDDEPRSQGFIEKATSTLLDKEIDEETFDDLFWDLEMSLLENNVAQPVVESLKERLHDELVDTTIRRSQAAGHVEDALRKSIESVLREPDSTITEQARGSTAFTVVLVGVNGAGKTTTAAKIAYRARQEGLDTVLGAADTYRAAAIQQLQEHGDELNTKVISHDYGADPAAVAYDTVEHAETQGKELALIDTAGRLHTDANLMDQLAKIVRVAEPDLVLYVGESLAGTDAVRQVKAFNEDIPLGGSVLTKADADDKGGAVLSVGYVTDRPIYYLGTGQSYEDLKAFTTERVVEELGL